ncbi:TetR/AcrR family transcriptional regulator [Stutzerimonas chloritidismutans]|uniref:TetR/AcrR family transcriptional regulator n=1 Tax=Stutzerimonas chloritidismutans TaxID=203192 RepID=UPI003F16F430
MATNKRDLLLGTAERLFYTEGYHATGIDRILSESGVAKMTLYKHFKSKDELILAVLDARHQPMLERLAAARDKRPPREALLGVFDGLDAMIHSPTAFCGCLFINAAAEYQDRDHPIHQRAALHKARFKGHLLALLEDMKAEQPERLARQLQFLIEGALSMAHIEGPADQAKLAKAAAEQLLQTAGL